MKTFLAAVTCALLGGSVFAAAPTSDDFSGATTLDAKWTVTNGCVGDPGTVSILWGTDDSDAWMTVQAEADCDPYVTGNKSLRVMQNMTDVSFDMAVKFDHLPSTQNATNGCVGQGIMVQDAGANYLRFDMYRCGSGALTLYGSRMTATTSSGDYNLPVVEQCTNNQSCSGRTMWLRVARVGTTWQLWYKPAAKWKLAHTITGYPLTPAKAGFHALANATHTQTWRAFIDRVDVGGTKIAEAFPIDTPTTPSAPVITQQPVSTSIAIGGTATFVAGAGAGVTMTMGASGASGASGTFAFSSAFPSSFPSACADVPMSDLNSVICPSTSFLVRSDTMRAPIAATTPPSAVTSVARATSISGVRVIDESP